MKYYVIYAKVKFNSDDEVEEQYVGRDLYSEHAYWCNEHDEDIAVFNSIEDAKKWFAKEKAHLCGPNVEISKVNIARIVRVDVDVDLLAEEPTSAWRFSMGSCAD